MVRLITKAAVASLLALCGNNSLADQLHYNNIIVGDRASGLAGAYTAISDDASGLFYNPAGIVFTENLQLSASANAIHSSTTTYKNVLNGGDWERESSTLIANFFGITKKLGSGYFGFSYAVPDFIAEDQDSQFTTIPGIPLYIININNYDKVTKLGPSYAIKISDQWNFGATLYLHNRETELINNQFIRLPNNAFEWSNSYFESSETGIEPVIGLMWTPDTSMSFGLSVRKTKILSSKTSLQVSCVSDVNNPTLQPPQCIPVAGSPADPTIVTSTEKREVPLNVRFGFAYFPTEKLLFSTDLSYYESVESEIFSAQEVLNVAIGTEYYFNPSWALRGGIFTNNANSPEIVPGKINQTDHVDLKGLSLSISRFSKSASITIGYTFSSGDGQAQVIAGSPEIQTLEHTVQTLYLSTSYDF
jgi:long-subunit fatty acid transport protein